MQLPDLNDLREAGGRMLDTAGDTLTDVMNDPQGVASDALDSLSDSVSGAYGDYISPMIPDSVENFVGLRREATRIGRESEPERAGLFGEVFESILKRVFPDASEAYDVINNILMNPRESWEFENEFEVVTAIFGMMPDSFQRFVLENTLVPLLRRVGLEELAELASTNPDNFINRLRTMESDIAALYTGLRTFGVVR
jgi:hypothetical protein